MLLDQEYWNNRYLDENHPWDASAPTPPLQHFIDSLTDKKLKILVPGAGFGHEAAYLYNNGFTNTFICDWSEEALRLIKEKHPQFPSENLIGGDFFKLDMTFNLVLEQTFFCALPPKLRPDYIKKMHEILSPKGLLVGLLWSENFEKPGPPFGGTKEEYQKSFSPYFNILEMDLTPHSIKPRLGRELFVRFQKKA